MSDKIWYRVQHAKSGTVEKMARAWDDGDKEADQAEVLEAPAASEEDSAADRVEVSEVPAVLVEYSAMARAGVLEVPEVSEKDSVEDWAGVLEVPAVSGGDSVVALMLVPAVSGGDRVMVPAFVAYKTDSMENRVAGMALAEALEASAEVPAYAYDRRRYPA